MVDLKKYNGSTWVDTTLRQYKTATADIEPTIYTDGTAITAYTLKGNEEHTGTPTPSNPVDVNGVGNKTANLYDIGAATHQVLYADGTIAYESAMDLSGFIKVNGDYTVSWTATRNGAFMRVSTYDDNKVFIERITATNTFTEAQYSNSHSGYIRINYENSYGLTNVMLNTGSTAQSYEPYGYKIPISSGQQTIEIYIGDLPLLKSLDGTAVDEISNGTLTRRVDSDGSVLPTPTTTQITMPSIPTTQGANSITVDTTVQPSEFTATWTGWHNASVKEKSENFAYDILVQDLQTLYSIVLLFSADLEPDTTYTLSFDSISGFYFYINELVFNVKYISTVTGRNQVICTTKSTLDKSDNRQYLNGRWIILKNAMNQPTNIDITNVMFNSGQTALPYVPYWK